MTLKAPFPYFGGKSKHNIRSKQCDTSRSDQNPRRP